MKIISARGIETISDDKLRGLFQTGRLLGAPVGGGVAQGQ